MGKLALSAKTLTILIGIVAGAAITVTAAILIFSNKEDAYRIIKVFETQGSSTVEREGEVLDAYEGMALESGDSIEVKSDSYLRLSLDSDKYILAESGTIFRLEASGDAKNSMTKITLEEGALDNDISEKLSDESSYEINTPTATMFVRGTNWRVWIEKDEAGNLVTKIMVLDGCVEIFCIQPDGSIDAVGNKVYAGEVGTVISGTTTYFEKGDFNTNEIPDYVADFWNELISAGRALVLPSNVSDNSASANGVSQNAGEYQITFCYGLQGENQQVVTVKNGEDAVAPSAGDIEVFGFDFVEWDKDYTAVTKNATINAVYQAKEINHTVNYYTEEGWKTDTVVHAYDESDYDSWTPNQDEYACAGLEMVGWTTQDTSGIEKSYTAQYRAKVSFVVDGATTSTTYVKLGDALLLSAYPEIPVKTGYDQVTPKWDIESLPEVTKATTITAVYTKNQYDVTFSYMNSQGVATTSVVKTGYMENAVAPSNDVINTWYGHTFSRWDKSFHGITSNITVTAIYDTKVYSIIFPTNKEGYELIGEKTCPYGVTYNFTIKVLAGYTQSKPLVRVNGTVLNSATPRYVGSEVYYDYSIVVIQDILLDVTGLSKGSCTVTLNLETCNYSDDNIFYFREGTGDATHALTEMNYVLKSTTTVVVPNGSKLSESDIPVIEGAFLDNWNEVSQMTITQDCTITLQYRYAYMVKLYRGGSYYIYFLSPNTLINYPNADLLNETIGCNVTPSGNQAGTPITSDISEELPAGTPPTQ